MHLLNVHTRQLQEFFAGDIPPFAILSHTWGEDEVLYQDLPDPKHKEKLGYTKIEGCCRQAIRDKFEFVWVDTCCIDKRSSAELSEAVNSMFGWYGEAQVCYVYLVDVPSGDDPYKPYSAFSNSRWFTRGWTLQELIAPVELKFFDMTWARIFSIDKGSRLKWDPDSCGSLIEQITGIQGWYKYSIHNINRELKEIPVAMKLSWVSGRHTTRVEDMAYCLLGLLDVNMPLLYGEGYRAFLRLQEEFLKKCFDPTIVLWGFGMDRSDIKNIGASFRPSCLAPTPRLFRGFRGTCLEKTSFPWNGTSRLIWTVTPYGLHVELPVLRIDARSDIYVCVTNYAVTEIKGSARQHPADEEADGRSHYGKRLVLPLQRCQGSDVYRWAPECGPLFLRMSTRWFKPNKPAWKTVYLDIDSEYYKREYGRNNLSGPPFWYPEHGRAVYVDIKMLLENRFALDSVYPPTMGLMGSWVYYTNETCFNLVLQREQRHTLYVQVTCPLYNLWDRSEQRGCKALVCLSSYDERRPAIEVWDAGRKAWKRKFCDPPRLNWQETATVDVERRVEHISLTFEPRHMGCVIKAKVETRDNSLSYDSGIESATGCGRSRNPQLPSQQKVSNYGRRLTIGLTRMVLR
ncbi:hypothetical protein EKO27_g933 [Xylaria grammica]|uniref:Heterokaryon incompatibility domain-containing protein n=1 Tax=Xylaria grammica TaxID=363999 RepID=A0A439DIF3_9PEZI|nr:hypothetical protein EKO27_g933 [Xylaria grammica]